MYEEYFGLERPPFKITPDTSLFYEGGKRGDILSALAYTIHRGEGIIKVVGEVGSGKTMLCRMLQLKLPDTVEIVYIANPSVSAEDILFVIAHELSLRVDKGASKHEVMHMLQDYLLQRHMENKQVVLFIEEAQGMPLDTLEEIRLLSNLETAEHKLLQIILFGQPELDQNLAQRSIRQLRERITHNFELEPLTQDEIHNYLNFRMRQVGYTGPELISDTVAKKVEQHSAGLLRRINIIADKILLSAFAEGTHNLSAKHVNEAVNDSSFESESPRRSRSWWLVPLLLLVIAALLYQTRVQWLAWVPHGLSDSPVASQPTDSNAGNGAESAIENTTENTPGSTENLAAAEMAVGAEANEGSGAEPVSSSTRIDETDDSASAAEVEAPAEVVAAVSPESATAITATGTAGVESGADNELQSAQSELAPDVGLTEAELDAGSEMQTSQPDSAIVVTGTVKTGAGADNEIQRLETDSMASSELNAPEQEQNIEQLSDQVDNLLSEVEVAIQQAEAEPDGQPANAKISVDSQPEIDSSGLSAVNATDAGIKPANYRQWLYAKLEMSEVWLDQMDRDKLSIQVMMRKKTAARDLVYYLRNEWPLNLSQTYMYEVIIEGRSIYRVLYSEYDSVAQARAKIDELPDSIKANSPYVLSIHQIRKALL